MDQIEQLQQRVCALITSMKELQEKLQQQAVDLARMGNELDAAIAINDHNTGAFRDTLQVLDARGCVQEAVIRDIAVDLARPLLERVALHRTADGSLDAESYFAVWKRQVLKEEAAGADPYEGATIFGGTDAKVDEPKG